MSLRRYAFVELDRPLRPGTTRFQQLAAETEDHGPHLLIAMMDDSEVRERQRTDRYIAHAPEIPVRDIEPVAVPGVPLHNDGKRLWGINAIGADQCEYHGDGVTVAILDSGIDLEHAAFKPVRDRIKVTDYIGAGPGDGTGHGTHCAGTICGQDVDGVRIGIARQIETLYVGRVFDTRGHGDSLSLFRGIQDAIMNRANVLSMSLGFDFPGFVELLISSEGYPPKLAAARALTDLMQNVRVFDTYALLAHRLVHMTGGTLIVAAAGNESSASYRLPVSLPAAAERVISVGAVAPGSGAWEIAPFSNTGPTVCGPGVGVLSALAGTGTQLGAKSGTSMATPHVAGVAALWFQALRARKQPSLAPTVERQMLQSCKATFASTVAHVERGVGMVQAP
jgi:subtilisin family serine protease